MRHLNAQRGVTLIELMVTITIAAILLTVGAPMLADYIANSRLRAAGEAVLSQVLFAQQEAIKRNGVVRLVVSGASLEVFDRSTSPATLLRTQQLPDGIAATATKVPDFDSFGRPATFGDTYAIDLSASGITCSNDYRCPSVRVDVGGGVRLCSDKNNCS
ncbi:MAG TPA: GspH/FimT family pseudopilin [Burkholderiaceae bacterium]|nr:GspH/FimT family pseudopilin [Burkholderiaceae bacterium]